MKKLSNYPDVIQLCAVFVGLAKILPKITNSTKVDIQDIISYFQLFKRIRKVLMATVPDHDFR